MFYKEHKRPIEIPPDTQDDMPEPTAWNGMITLVRHVLAADRKYVKKNTKMRVLPSETEEDLLNRWLVDVHSGKVKDTDAWKRYQERRHKESACYEWHSGDMHPLEKPSRDQ
jgi:hypothetical protein